MIKPASLCQPKFYLENELGKVVVVAPAAGVAEDADDSALLLAPEDESGS